MKVIAALHPNSWVFLLFALAWGLCACNSSNQEGPRFQPGRAQFNTAPFSIAEIASNPDIAQRVFSMPFGEAVARLGSLHFEATSSFAFTQGANTVQQDNTYLATEDSLGNFHIRFQTPHSSIEAYQIGPDFFIRQNKGNLRKKPRRDIESEEWGQRAFSSLDQTLEIFRPQLQLSQGATDQHLGRKALKVSLSLNKDAVARPVKANDLPSSRLAVSVPNQWRELAQPLAISGTLWIDEESGVVVRSQIKGKLEISDREVRPTQLEISYESSVTDIAKVRPIKAQKNIPEHQRNKPPRNLLGFMKKHLPNPKEAPKPTTAN